MGSVAPQYAGSSWYAGSGIKPCLLHRQVDPLPMSHQGGPHTGLYVGRQGRCSVCEAELEWGAGKEGL